MILKKTVAYEKPKNNHEFLVKNLSLIFEVMAFIINKPTVKKLNNK